VVQDISVDRASLHLPSIRFPVRGDLVIFTIKISLKIEGIDSMEKSQRI
jgi:hypothetical protein